MSEPAEELIIIRTIEEMQNLQTYLADKEFIAYDTETTGVEQDAEIIGFSVSSEPNIGFYIILSYWDPEAKELKHLETKDKAADFMRFLTTKGQCLLMHNAVFDCAKTKENFGVELMPYVHTDTMILAHVINENRRCGLKELAVSIFGEDSRKEQTEMKASVSKNGGVLTKKKYELYKADAELIAKYGAKDTILTFKLFLHLVPELIEQGLYDFFYTDESMPLLRGPTYQLNTVGLRIDAEKLTKLRSELEAECLEATGYIYSQVTPLVSDKYPGTKKTNTFNVEACQQLSWLLFERLDNYFNTLTKSGRELCHAMDLKLPYALADKRAFTDMCRSLKGQVWQEPKWNWKTKKMSRAKKIEDPWKYFACGKETLMKFSEKYPWVKKRLELAKAKKLLNTYVMGIQARAHYNIIRSSFLQIGTTSGRFSSKSPNFQNLPRDDKRVKSCIISRPGKVFVGADYKQLEPRVFASFSKDERLMNCFSRGDDFYSVIGVEIFNKKGECSVKEGDPNFFGKLFKPLRQQAKGVALAATYGVTAPKLVMAFASQGQEVSMQEAQEIIDNYFEQFPSVERMMLESHETVKKEGQVINLFGRPRRMPAAMDIEATFGNEKHAKLPYETRKMLNLAVNHRIQGTGASIMNRAAIAVDEKRKNYATAQPLWNEVAIVLQVHDELILEGPADLHREMVALLKDCMENTVVLPGVALIADPAVGKNLAELK